ncbi:NAD-dependent histone deacetylase Sir2 [Spironucleus salmonicida]|uniref:NAD-dependent histone deacetylase Sir2 n=1 Tax=Spironucleus salmonicida TaxID=348837 RepID=V6M3U6_9EUKA|nr:NAD-dependent histone deacetylase Sir2 [Spironucleus salmonicida]|eukprot:EST47984.1 NAD-dependent histone deacetylase Sir2 [Spironucleus salmonicida]
MSIEDSVQLIRDASSILILAGAGISVSAGIPDFRSPKTGIYDQLAHYKLPTPTSIFDIAYFPKRPRPFFHLSKSIFPSTEFQHTVTHAFFAYLQKTKQTQILTQNIDDLEIQAGAVANPVHGSFMSPAKCVSCGRSFPTINIKAAAVDDAVSFCVCGGVVKPGIVFFGENVNITPQQISQLAPDLLIVAGTSLRVGPVNQIPLMVKCPKIFINREAPPAEYAFEQFLQGDCDDVVEVLLEQLGALAAVRKQRLELLKIQKNWGACDAAVAVDLELICVSGGLRVPTAVGFGRAMYCLADQKQIRLLAEVAQESICALETRNLPHQFKAFAAPKVRVFHVESDVYRPIYGHYSSYLTQFVEYFEDEIDIWDLVTDVSQEESECTGVKINVLEKFLTEGVENQFVFEKRLKVVKTTCQPVEAEIMRQIRVKMTFEDSSEAVLRAARTRFSECKNQLFGMIFEGSKRRCAGADCSISNERILVEFSFLEKYVQELNNNDMYLIVRDLLKNLFKNCVGIMLMK